MVADQKPITVVVFRQGCFSLRSHVLRVLWQRDYSQIYALSKQTCVIFIPTAFSFSHSAFVSVCHTRSKPGPSSLCILPAPVTQHRTAPSPAGFIFKFCICVCQYRTFHLTGYALAGEEISPVCYRIAITDGGHRSNYPGVVEALLRALPDLSISAGHLPTTHHPQYER